MLEIVGANTSTRCGLVRHCDRPQRPPSEPGVFARLASQHSVDGCATDFQGFGNCRRPNALSLHLPDLRGIDARLAALVDAARLGIGNPFQAGARGVGSSRTPRTSRRPISWRTTILCSALALRASLRR
jgi:hypothetical protein